MPSKPKVNALLLDIAQGGTPDVADVLAAFDRAVDPTKKAQLLAYVARNLEPATEIVVVDEPAPAPAPEPEPEVDPFDIKLLRKSARHLVNQKVAEFATATGKSPVKAEIALNNEVKELTGDPKATAYNVVLGHLVAAGQDA